MSTPLQSRVALVSSDVLRMARAALERDHPQFALETCEMCDGSGIWHPPGSDRGLCSACCAFGVWAVHPVASGAFTMVDLVPEMFPAEKFGRAALARKEDPA